jgi:hypothetical protein
MDLKSKNLVRVEISAFATLTQSAGASGPGGPVEASRRGGLLDQSGPVARRFSLWPVSGSVILMDWPNSSWQPKARDGTYVTTAQ